MTSTLKSRAGWTVARRDGWGCKIIGENLDIEAAFQLAHDTKTVQAIFFHAAGNVGLSALEAEAAVFGTPELKSTPAPMSAPGCDRAWADGPGADPSA